MKLTDLTRYILPGDKTQDILDQAARARAAVERSAAALHGRAVPLDSAVSAQMEARGSFPRFRRSEGRGDEQERKSHGFSSLARPPSLLIS